MRKKNFKTLRFTKAVISNLASEKAKGGVSGACTSSVNPNACHLGCPESVYTPCG